MEVLFYFVYIKRKPRGIRHVNESWTVAEQKKIFRCDESRREVCCCKGEEIWEEGFKGKFVIVRKRRLGTKNLGKSKKIRLCR